VALFNHQVGAVPCNHGLSVRALFWHIMLETKCLTRRARAPARRLTAFPTWTTPLATSWARARAALKSARNCAKPGCALCSRAAWLTNRARAPQQQFNLFMCFKMAGCHQTLLNDCDAIVAVAHRNLDPTINNALYNGSVGGGSDTNPNMCAFPSSCEECVFFFWYCALRARVDNCRQVIWIPTTRRQLCHRQQHVRQAQRFSGRGGNARSRRSVVRVCGSVGDEDCRFVEVTNNV